MKALIILSFIVFFNIFGLRADVLRIRLSNSSGEFSQLGEDLPNTPLPNSSDCVALAWTNNNVPTKGRHLIKFDLSQLPVNATLISAHLSFFGNMNPVNPLNSTIGGSNEAYLRRVIQNWSSSTACFNNQPSFTTVNQVLLPASTQPVQDYLNIDVTDLFKDMVLSNQNFGFIFMLQTEVHYRSMNFTGGGSPDTSRQPLLEIEYDACTPFVYNDSLGFEDAVVSNISPSSNFLNSTDFVAFASNIGGVQFYGRSFINFNTGLIPSGSTINNAYLNLYANQNPAFPASTSSGGNECLLMRVNQNWNPLLLNFSNQPSSVLQNALLLQAPVTPLQDYLNLDVTALLNDAFLNPNSSYGFVLQLINETGNRSLNFCSANCPDSSRRPSLRICYTNPQGIVENNVLPLLIYPNPSSGSFCIKGTGHARYIEVYDVLGKLVYAASMNSSDHENWFDLKGNKPGLYVVKSAVGDQLQLQKLILR